MSYMRITGAGQCLIGWFLIFVMGGVVLGGEYEPLLDREAVMESAGQVSLEVYPNADEVIVDDFIRAVYEKDGTAVELDDSYTKVLTEKGKRDNQSQSYHFTIPYDEIEVAVLEIIKPDGRVEKVDVAGQSKEMTDPSQMGSNIYNPNSKILEIGISGLEIGDVLHSLVIRKTVKTRMPEQWSDYQVFEYYNPIKHATYEVLAPKDKPLQCIAIKDEVAGSVNYSKDEKDDRIAYRWEFNNVARIFPEPDMPAFYTVVQRVLVSTLANWESVSSWYWRLSEPHFEADEDMKTKAAELTDGLTDDMEKIRSIFKFVSQEIRYLGITIEKEAPGYEPHDAKMTFANRHGVCRDKAALLVAMLRVAGFEAFPVLIHSGPKKDEEVPGPYFNHAISCVRNGEGSYILIDSTDESTKELLPEYLNDCSYLVATPEGDRLRVSPIVPADENMLDITTKAKVKADGGYEARSEMVFEGINDNAYRSYFARITPDQRKEYFEGVVKGILPGAKLESFEIEPSDILDTGKEIKVNFSNSADDVLVRNGEKAMMPVYSIGSRVGMVNFVLGKAGLKQRRFPLETGFACGVKEDIEIEIASEVGQVVSVPEYKKIDDETMLLDRNFELDANKVQGSSIFKIKVVEFNPEQYLQLKESLEDIEYDGRKMMIIGSHEYQSSLADEDSEIIEDEMNYTVNEDGSWTLRAKIKKRILTYKGKKDNSELKFSYNPAWAEFNLIDALVMTGGMVKEISEQEKNLMDAAWVGSAPRYPAEKIMVASLPGVEVGSVIEYEYEITYKDRPFFEMLEYMRVYDPILHKKVRLDVPAEMELKMLVDDDGVSVDNEQNEGVIRSTVKRENDRVVYEWSVEQQAGVKVERSLPPLYSFVPIIKASSGDWKEYCDVIKTHIKRAAANQEQSSEKAKELTKGIWKAQEKIIAIRDFVVKNVRLAGPGVGGLPFESVSNADVTLKDGYGNSMDRAILMYSMLEAIGINCDIVLACGEDRIDQLEKFRKDYPDIETFNEALVRISLDSKDIYLNNTSQYSQIGANSSDRYISLAPGSCRLERIEIKDDLRTKSRTNIKISLDDSGDALIEIEQVHFGSNFEQYNRKFSELRPEELNRYYQEIVADLSQSAQAQTELIHEYEQYPGVMKFTAKVSRFAVLDGEYYYFKLPGGFGNVFGIRGDIRHNALMYPFYLDSEVCIDVELPAGYQKLVLVPGDAVFKVQGGEGEFRLITEQRSADAMRITYRMELVPQIIEAQDYSKLIGLTGKLTHDRNRTILLEKGESSFELPAKSSGRQGWRFPFFSLTKLFGGHSDVAENVIK